ncbi:DUF4180 domain-containing protein [Paenibacillus massiliensis]|uniref:DUF4180 domain-containing protein n=1 Tax=Paenibacillus massiliensis TaxID=225917 RepID=UPI00037D54D9|nr:DUF4180 domain-containing protein [Paenibacillus massiliensis]
MSIQYAILGILSWRPATGYELKKVFEESTILYWSGNNNQIYKSLVQLLEEGMVTNEIQHQESSPSKKIYSITEKGLAGLKEWALSEPEVPDFKNAFLVQLACSDQLSNEELKELLLQYKDRINVQLVYQQEKIRRGMSSPRRNAREAVVADKIADNLLSFYRNELKWVHELHSELEELYTRQKEELKSMNYQVVQNGETKYIEVISAEPPLSKEQDAVDLVALSMENDVHLMLLHSQALSEDFFKLGTGVAGGMIQKWINYQLQVAAVIPGELIHQGRFKEMAVEANKSNHFRVFETKVEAEQWFLRG